MELDLESDQIDKITKTPGITAYIGKETFLEKFSIPKVIFKRYNPTIMARVVPRDIIQARKNEFSLKIELNN